MLTSDGGHEAVQKLNGCPGVAHLGTEGRINSNLLVASVEGGNRVPIRPVGRSPKPQPLKALETKML